MRIHELGRDEVARQSPPGGGLGFPASSEKGFSARRILLVGTGALAAQSASAAAKAEDVYIVGAVDCQPQPNWCLHHPNVPLLGTMADVEALVGAHCIDEIRVALPAESHQAALPALEATVRKLGVAMAICLPQKPCSSRRRMNADFRMVVHQPQHPSNRGARRVVKRSIDVLVSGSALLLLMPLLAVIAVVIKLTSAGPVLFRQQRIGLRRRQFRMLKFRTMLKNAEELRARIREHNNARGISFKVFDDPRVTRVGSILRRTSLDELPQLFNVLRGEMSLVGPRPIPVWVAEQMHGTAYLRRFSVKQGLTGLWQVEGRQQDFDYMATQDLRYVDNWSLFLDFKILWRTIPAMIRGEGAH